MSNDPYAGEREVLSESIRELKELIASAGWRTYTTLVESQCRAREQKFLYTPLPDADSVYAQEYAKGEIHALRLTATLPETMIESFESELEDLPSLKENPDEV